MYADYVFKQAGIPTDKIPYVTVGTGACECITALTCVSMNCTLYFQVLRVYIIYIELINVETGAAKLEEHDFNDLLLCL